MTHRRERNGGTAVIWTNDLEQYILHKTACFILKAVTYDEETRAYHIDIRKIESLDVRPVFTEEDVRELERFLKKPSY